MWSWKASRCGRSGRTRQEERGVDGEREGPAGPAGDHGPVPDGGKGKAESPARGRRPEESLRGEGDEVPRREAGVRAAPEGKTGEGAGDRGGAGQGGEGQGQADVDQDEQGILRDAQGDRADEADERRPGRGASFGPGAVRGGGEAPGGTFEGCGRGGRKVPRAHGGHRGEDGEVR